MITNATRYRQSASACALLVRVRRVKLEAAGRLQIPVGRTRILAIVSEGIPVFKEVAHRFDRDRKTESFAKRQLHIRDPNDLSPRIEQRASAIARINL